MARIPEQILDHSAASDDPTVPTIRKSAAPLRRNVVDALRKAIIDGRLVPQSRLVERELIEMTGVSRTVVREALRQLESEGLIDIIPNKGPIVRKLTLEEAKDLYLIRSVLEGLAARMCVENATSEDIAQLRKALDATAAAYKKKDPEHILDAKNQFYDVLFGGANSETLSAMIATLYARIRRWRALGLAHPKRSPSRSQESVGALRALVEAIEARDGDRAEAIAREEVTKAAAEVMSLLEQQEEASEKEH